MTEYSVLTTGARATILATWQGETSNTSIKVTTLYDIERAAYLAESLTTMSEAAWYAAAWLDTWPPIRAHLEAVAQWLREPTLAAPPPGVDLSGCRHAQVDASFEYCGDRGWCEGVFFDAALTHPQRLAIAAELETEVQQMVRTLEGHHAGEHEGLVERGWQLLQVGRSTQLGGDLNYLPDGAAGWATRWFGAELPAERWAARCQLLRMEQLEAACAAVGGRGHAHQEPVEAHCVLPGETSDQDFIVHAAPEHASYVRYHATRPMRVRKQVGNGDQVETSIDPLDTEGFARFLGDWVTAIPLRA